MVGMTIIARVILEKQQEFVQVMRTLQHEGRQEKGRCPFTLYQEIEGEPGFALIYEWETREALEECITTDRFRVLLGALKVLCETSEIRYSSKADNAMVAQTGSHKGQLKGADSHRPRIVPEN